MIAIPGLAGDIAAGLPQSAVLDLYGRAGADVYEHLVAQDHSDVSAILRALGRCDGAVLELACGGGRVTEALLRAGHRVHAVDNSPTMLELLAARCARWLDAELTMSCMDMAQLRCDERYGAVVVAAGSIVLLDTEVRQAALARIRACLRPGGLAVLTGLDVATREVPERVIPLGGRLRGRVIEYVDADRGWRWTSVALEDGDGRVERLLWSRPRLLSAATLSREVGLAGFDDVATAPLPSAGGPVSDRQWLLRARAPRSKPSARPVVFFASPQRAGPRAVRASGCEVEFDDGVVAIDGASGLWNVNLGYGNRAIADALHQAHLDASYLTLFRRGHRHAEAASAALASFAAPIPVERVLFSTCGGAAVDAAQKVVRQYHALRGQAERRLVVGLMGSYHGMTLGGLALTGEDLGQRALGVDRSLVRHIRHDSADAFRRLMRRDSAYVGAVVVEPVLGSGAHVVSGELLDALFRARRETGLVIVADEVATGFGRCGPAFRSQDWDEPPDLLITSKGLTNGTCAAAAVLIGPRIALPFDIAGAAYVHGETQAGTPPTCAAICATIDEFARLDALAAGARVALRLDSRLGSMLDELDAVAGVRGLGCMRAIELRERSGRAMSAERIAEIVESCRLAGAIVHPGPSCVQLLPVLTCSDRELDLLLSRVHEALAAA